MIDLRIRGIVVYDTSTGTTKKIAETMTETLREYGMDSDLCYVMEVKKLNTKDYNFLALGCRYNAELGLCSQPFYMHRVGYRCSLRSGSIYGYEALKRKKRNA